MTAFTGLVVLWVVSVSAMVARWSYCWHAGAYFHNGDTRSETSDRIFFSFLGALLLGVLPPLAVGYVIGVAASHRALLKAAEARRLEHELRDLDRALEAR